MSTYTDIPQQPYTFPAPGRKFFVSDGLSLTRDDFESIDSITNEDGSTVYVEGTDYNVLNTKKGRIENVTIPENTLVKISFTTEDTHMVFATIGDLNLWLVKADGPLNYPKNGTLHAAEVEDTLGTGEVICSIRNDVQNYNGGSLLSEPEVQSLVDSLHAQNAGFFNSVDNEGRDTLEQYQYQKKESAEERSEELKADGFYVDMSDMFDGSNLRRMAYNTSNRENVRRIADKLLWAVNQRTGNGHVWPEYLESYSGKGVVNVNLTKYQGDALNWEVNGLEATGQTVISIKSGTGEFIEGDVIQFSGFTDEYEVLEPLYNGGGTMNRIRIGNGGLLNDMPDGTAITTIRGLTKAERVVRAFNEREREIYSEGNKYIRDIFNAITILDLLLVVDERI